MTRRILFAGGGTAGHVFPALAVADELKRQAPDVEPVFIGVADRLEARLVPRAGFRMHQIEAVSVPRRPSPQLLRVPGAVRAAVRQCRSIIEQEGAHAAVTFGGYVSFPLDRAAASTNLPLVIHEQNAIPGLTNRLAARWADRVAVSFPGSTHRFHRPERCVVTGNPVRDEVLRLDVDAHRVNARRHFDLDPHLPTVLVFGGSQGARSLNRAVIDSYSRWGTTQLQILHASGRRLHDESETAWDEARLQRPEGPTVRLVDFIDDMADAYAAADVVVCRAGATSIAELTVLGIPAVLVPFPHATADHQTANAQALARAGGATVIQDADLDGTAFVTAVEPLLTDRAHHDRVARASRVFGRPDAAANVAQLALQLLETRES